MNRAERDRETNRRSARAASRAKTRLVAAHKPEYDTLRRAAYYALAIERPHLTPQRLRNAADSRARTALKDAHDEEYRRYRAEEAQRERQPAATQAA